MTATSESTKAIEEILRREFDADHVFDKSYNDSNLTLRVDKRRYRIALPKKDCGFFIRRHENPGATTN